MVTWFSEEGVDQLFFISLFIYGVCTLSLLQFKFSTLQVLLLFIPGVIAGFVYQRAKKSFSDYFYYFILDGLMMFSALLMLILGI
jgi:hypothetical protein